MSLADSASVRMDDGSRATQKRHPSSDGGFLSDNGRVWVFPGLGCRYVGMGHDLFGSSPAADGLFEEAASHLNCDIRDLCLEGSGRKTVPSRQEAQIIYTVSCGYAATLRALNHHPLATTGHSLGNWAAAWAAGCYDFQTGLDLVTHVEDLLEELIPSGLQTMGAIIGLDEAVIESLLSQHPNVWMSNWNSPGQTIIGGDASGVDAILSVAAGMNAKRAKRLQTERALHTPLMQTVSARLRERLDNVRWFEPEVPFVASSDSRLLRTADDVRGFFGTFLDQPVRWDATVRAIRQQTPADFVEVGPGNVLGSMLPFIDKTARICSASELLELEVST